MKKIVVGITLAVVSVVSLTAVGQTISGNLKEKGNNSDYVVVANFNNVIIATQQHVRGTGPHKITKKEFNSLEKISQTSNPVGKVVCIVNMRHTLKGQVEESCRIPKEE